MDVRLTVKPIARAVVIRGDQRLQQVLPKAPSDPENEAYLTATPIADGSFP